MDGILSPEIALDSTGRLTDKAIDMVVASMCVKIRKELEKMVALPGDTIKVTYELTITK